MKKKITIALAGNPNAGKTSLFNQLTGARAHVGNYPGVTVQKKEGLLQHDGWEIHVVDLPGTYSLTAYSLEELVARNFILEERPDVVVDVVDATNLDRNLYLALQFMEIGVPLVIASNMMDMAESMGLKIDLEKLKTLLEVEVVPTVARQGKGLDRLLDSVVRVAEENREWRPKNIRYGPDLDIKIREISSLLMESRFPTDKYPARWLAVKCLEGDQEVLKLVGGDEAVGRKINAAVEDLTRHLRVTLDDEPEGIIADQRYGFIASVTKQAVTTEGDFRRTISDKIDLVLLNRLLGPIILLAVLYAIYHLIFWVSGAPVAWFEAFFKCLGGAVNSIMPEGFLRSLVVSGLIDGVGGVIGFVPLIAFMFFAIAVLEDSGYLARIAFIMDRILRTFGLHGNSVLALMIGGGIAGGCAVPGIMAARTLRDPKERLATILVTPLMNCGAKLPVYAVLIAAFFARHEGRMLFLLTLISWGLALLAARILRWTVLRGEHSPFVMELPPYRLPTFKGLLIHSWERVWEYIKKAGTIILAISVVIWVLMTFPALPEDLAQGFQNQRRQAEQVFLAGPGGKILPHTGALNEFNEYYQLFQTKKVKRTGEDFQRDYYALARAVWALAQGVPLDPELEVDSAPAQGYLYYRRRIQEIGVEEAGLALRRSFGGRLGLLLEKITRPLGFDWRTNIALVGGFAAKEVVISTLGTAYSLSATEEEASKSLAEKLASQPDWNPLVAFTLILFVMVYSPCAATLVVIVREAGWGWGVFAMFYTTISAYLLCLAAAQVGKALGLGL